MPIVYRPQAWNANKKQTQEVQRGCETALANAQLPPHHLCQSQAEDCKNSLGFLDGYVITRERNLLLLPPSSSTVRCFSALPAATTTGTDQTRDKTAVQKRECPVLVSGNVYIQQQNACTRGFAFLSRHTNCEVDTTDPANVHGTPRKETKKIDVRERI